MKRKKLELTKYEKMGAFNKAKEKYKSKLMSRTED